MHHFAYSFFKQTANVILFTLLCACAFKPAALNKELAVLHKVPLKPDIPIIELSEPYREPYFYIDYTKPEKNIKPELFTLFQTTMKHNGKLIFALEPVSSSGRIEEEEMIAKTEELMTYMRQIGIPPVQIVRIDSARPQNTTLRGIKIYLQEE